MFLLLLSFLSLAHAATVQDSLKNAVIESRNRLGAFDPWQKTLFDEEVVPQYGKFIRDYRTVGAKTQAEVDIEAIKRYLYFYAPKNLKRDSHRVAIFLDIQKDCSKCTDSAAALKVILKSRVEHRGMTAVFIESTDLGSNELITYVRNKNLAGGIWARARFAEIEDEDGAHADEKNYEVSAQIWMRPVGDRNDKEMKGQGKLVVLENDALSATFEKVFTDAWTAIGSEAMAQGSLQDFGNEQAIVVISGIKDYRHLSRVKEQLKNLLGEQGSAVENRLVRGQAEFKVKSNKNSDEVKKLLSSLTTPPSGDPTLQVEVK